MNPRPLPFVLAASDHGPMIVSHFDFHQTREGAYGVGAQILGNGGYDNDELEFVNSTLRDLHDVHGGGITVLDCGANIGVHTLEMARTMHGWGEVVAFEPQERLFYALAGNVALANAFNATVKFGAVGRESGEIRIPKANFLKPGSYGSLELRGSSNTEFIGQTISYIDSDLTTVPIFAIDDLDLKKVKFIKIDVEGMEQDVLIGGRRTIETFKPTMLIEILKCGLDPVVEILSPMGYGFEVMNQNVVARPH